MKGMTRSSINESTFLDVFRKRLGLPDRRLYDTQEFVRDAYRAILKRDADEAGLAAHTAALLSGGMTRQGLLEVVADSDELFLSQARQFVGDAYRAILKRDADDTELAAHAAELHSGAMTRQRLLEMLEESDELFVRQARQFIGDAYLAILKRDADEAGLAANMSALRSGSITRRGVLEALADSKEHSLHMLKEAIEAEGPALDQARRFVCDAFLGILKRDADDAALVTYTNALLSGSMTRQGLLASLAGSREHLQQTVQIAMEDKGALSPFIFFKLRDSLDSRMAFVQDAYRGVLGRDPDIVEIEMHANALAGSLTRPNLLAWLMATEEFATKSSAQSTAIGSLAAVARDLLGPLLPRNSAAGDVMAAGIADVAADPSAEIGATAESVRRASAVARFLERRRDDS
jgi:hypothetical protein